MNRDVAEINVQQIRASGSEHADEFRGFVAGDPPGRIAQLPEPNPSEEMRRRFRNDDDVAEGKTLGFLALLRDDDGPEPLERSDLPIDVEHLRLEKGRTIGRDDWSRY